MTDDPQMDSPGPVEVVPGQEALFEPDTPVGDTTTMFGSDDDFREAHQHWRGMPEFHQEDLQPFSSVMIHFASLEDQRAFGRLIGQTIRQSGRKMASYWYPKAAIGVFADKRYRDASASPEEDEGSGS